MTQNEQAIANTLEIFRQSPGKLFKVDEIEKKWSTSTIRSTSVRS